MKNILLGMLLLLSSCSSAPVTDLRGTWGGDGTILTISGSLATFIFNCGDGEIPGKFSLNPAGDFKLTGTLDYGFCNQNLKIPCQPSATPEPAHYAGHVGGNVMTLAVTSLSAGSPLNYTLEQSVAGDIGDPCP